MGNGASVGAGPTSTELVLTQNQKQIITETWGIASKDIGVLVIGQEIFVRILIRGRKIRQLFGLETVSDEKLKTNDKFLDHANKIGAMLGKLLNEYCVDENKFRRNARHLAADHFIKLKVGFNPMYWSIFPTILGEVMTVYAPESFRSPGLGGDRKVRDDYTNAWVTFADIMVDIMQAAYIQSAKEP